MGVYLVKMRPNNEAGEMLKTVSCRLKRNCGTWKNREDIRLFRIFLTKCTVSKRIRIRRVLDAIFSIIKREILY